MTPPADPSTLSPSEKDALIAALLARVKALLEEVEGLRTENAALRDKLSLPPKTPRNSSKPPSQEMKANGETEPKPKSKSHAGAYRPLHPNPTRCREVWADCCPQCQADVTAVAQVPLHTYDWIEIPAITPDVTRVTLYGGTCPCCRGRFKAAAPRDVRRVRPSGRTCAPSCCICASLRRSRSSGWRGCSLICSGLRSAKARSPTSCTTAHPRSRPRQVRSSAVCCPAPCFNPTRPRPEWANGPSGPGSSIMPIAPVSSRRRTAARRWSKRSWATVAPTFGFPTA